MVALRIVGNARPLAISFTEEHFLGSPHIMANQQRAQKKWTMLCIEKKKTQDLPFILNAPLFLECMRAQLAF